MKLKHTLTALLLLVGMTAAAAQANLRALMAQLQRQHGVSFVYDAALPLDQPYQGPQLGHLPLDEALQLLFARTNIIYRVDGTNVLLKLKAPAAAQQSHTLSGYVAEQNGEPMINATVYDLTQGVGTTTNEHGFYSLTLAEGPHRVRFSYIGYEQQVLAVALTSDVARTVALVQSSSRISEVTVEGDLNSPVLTTQTGRRTLTPAELKTEYALMSSPDVIKTLQTLSGVAQGLELMSGLYVHGGGGDENLFLLDGTPLYQTNHLLGLFSSFNTDVIKNVDFYKSGFPARYGGRLSSVVDVRTADGDMAHWNGLYSIGLIDGRFQLEGPIVKERTSLNIGLRRTWSDLITRPVFAIVNRRQKDESTNLSYFFHDLNVKLTHVVDSLNKLQLSFYSGTDRFDVHSVYDETYDYNSSLQQDREDSRGKYSWGNDNLSFDWKHIFSPRLFANLSAVYTHNRAWYTFTNNDRTYYDNAVSNVFYENHRYRSIIDDIGLHADFDLRPVPSHHIRFGGAAVSHMFRPQTQSVELHFGNTAEGIDSLSEASHNHQPAQEISLYAENEMQLSPRWSVNLGARGDLFAVRKKTFLTLDPRLAMKYQVSHAASLKASCAWMTQQMHRLQNTYIDLPTDYWVPTTQRVPPMRSWQLSVGAYVQPSRHVVASAEVYYKRSRHLLQYSSWLGIDPPAESWDLYVDDGKGRAYGLDVDLGYRSERLTLDASYTLSKSERRFGRTYDSWFPDKFDNRHKLNLTARMHWRHTEFYAAWTFHTGNHITMPEHYAALPVLPNGSVRGQDHGNGHEWMTQYDAEFFYATPNNVTLPAYHRLDLGFNIHHKTKHGHERVWNWSIYNAYCRMNPFATRIKENSDGSFRIRSVGFVPIIPSFSYTIKF